MFEHKWLRLRYQVKCLAGERPRRVVFLHIPKCGGTSVHRHFKSNFGNGKSGQIALLDSMSGDLHEPARMQAARAAQYVSGHCGWNAVDAVGADAFRFTIVREPLARLQSLYLFARARPQSDHRVFAKLFDAAKKCDFASFCLTDDLELRALIDNAQARTLAHDYYPFRMDDAGSVLRAAVSNLAKLDYVIDASQLDHAFAPLATMTDTRLMRDRPRLNETPRQAQCISRQDFESDRRLDALIALDREVYEHAMGLARAPRRREAIAA